MHSMIYEMIYEANNDIFGDGFCDEWYKDIKDHSDSVQLNWILENTEIPKSTKRDIAHKIRTKAEEAEDEEDILLSVGVSSKDYQEFIESYGERESTKYLKKSWVKFAGWIVALMLYIIFDGFSDTQTGTLHYVTECIAIMSFGFGTIFLYESNMERLDAKNAKNIAQDFWDRLLGHKLQRRIAETERKREELYNLCTIIVENEEDLK